MNREPNLTTDASLLAVLDELMAREPIFHRPEFGTTRADFDHMMAVDYWEIGASGRRYGRAFVLDMLEKRHAVPHEDIWATKDFYCRRLSDDTYLLHYTLIQSRVRETRRTTLWKSTLDGWKILFHQGTVVEPEQG